MTTTQQHPIFKPGQLLRAKEDFAHSISTGDMFLLLALVHQNVGWQWMSTIVLSTGKIVKHVWWIEPFRVGVTEFAEVVEIT